jgi:hypothetical protein
MRRIGFVCVIMIAPLSAVRAAEDGCEKFAWPLARERAWFGIAQAQCINAKLTPVCRGVSLEPIVPTSKFAIHPTARRTRAGRRASPAISGPDRACNGVRADSHRR